MIALCTDSSSLLPPSVAVDLGVGVAPVDVTLDGRSFEDGIDLDVDAFYARLEQGARATTSQPSPGRLARLYEAAADSGATRVLSIHVDERLSGTVGAATLAARDARVPVTVVDTGTASFGVAICVMAAAESLAAGDSVAEVIRRINLVAAGIATVFVAGGAPGGRIASSPGLPLLSLVDGETRPVGTSADLDDAAAAMARYIAEQGEGLRIAVGHAARATRPAADALAEQLARSRGVVDVSRYRVGPSVGAHTGPLSFGAFWWTP
jgi:DegV family protein with EDD domain